MAEAANYNNNSNNNINNPLVAAAIPGALTRVTVTEGKSTKPEAAVAAQEEAKNSENKATMTTEKSESNDRGGSLGAMAARVKGLTGLLSILSFIVSLPILASVIWILYMRDYDCENLLRLPKLQTGIGIGLIFMFIMSTATLFLRAKFPMPAILLVLVPLLVMFTVGLALVGAYDMESRRIIASPRWFRMIMNDDNSWNNIKPCIYDTGVCQDLFARSLTTKSYDLSMSKLSPIESGCCKPPAICNMEFVNFTYWKKQDGDLNNSSPIDLDCDTWTNDRDILCYSCQACKEGYFRTLKSKWWKLGFFMVLMALFLTVSHLLLFLSTMWERLI